jgi:3-oxoadipate enol-lactonase
MRVELGSHSLQVERSGAPPPDLVCLHGLADSLSIWRALAPGLATLAAVTLVDQRAHGGSTAPPGPYRREDLARDVIAVLDRLAIERAVLVGHSMGGIVAMTTALLAPERVAGLVLLGTASQVSERAAGWYRKIAEAAEQGGIDGLRRAIFGAGSAREIAGDAAGMAQITRCLASLHADPLTARLTALRCPALLLVGDEDPMGPAASEIIHRNLSGSRLETMPGGHWLHVEAADRVLVFIRHFLASAALV